MKYLFYQNQNSVRPFATLIIDDPEIDYDEELDWFANILDCKVYERERE